MPGTAKSRRLRATTLRKLPASPVMPALSTMAAVALACCSAEKTGERTRRRRSSEPCSISSKAAEIALDIVQGTVRHGELEQGGRRSGRRRPMWNPVPKRLRHPRIVGVLAGVSPAIEGARNTGV